MPMEDPTAGHRGLWIIGFKPSSSFTTWSSFICKRGNDGNDRIGVLGGLFMYPLREMKKGLLILATTIILAVTFLD